MQSKPHTMLAVALAGIVIALAVTPAAFSYPASEPPPVPSAAATQADAPARAQQQYYTSYGQPQPLTRPEPPAASGDVDWLPIGIAAGASIALIALLGLVSHTRRTHRMRVVA